MKKILLAVAVVATLGLGLTSCDKEGCYIITTKATVLGQSIETKVYVWGDREDIKNAVDKANKEAAKVYKDFKISKQKVNKAQSECFGLPS